jgi:rpsU-divergently transcribed protein
MGFFLFDRPGKLILRFSIDFHYFFSILDKSFHRFYSISFNQNLNVLKPNINLVLATRKLTQSQILRNENPQGQGKPADPIEEFRKREIEREEEFNKSVEPVKEASETEEDDAEDETTEIIKKKILEAALPFVEVEGWTLKAVIKGAEVCNYPGVAHGMFPNGGIDLINYFYLKCNENLVEQMKTKICGVEKNVIPKEFVAWAIKTRLSMIIPYIKTWPQAQATMALPTNVPASLPNLLKLADDICYYSGDRSVDVSFFF